MCNSCQRGHLNFDPAHTVYPVVKMADGRRLFLFSLFFALFRENLATDDCSTDTPERMYKLP